MCITLQVSYLLLDVIKVMLIEKRPSKAFTEAKIQRYLHNL